MAVRRIFAGGIGAEFDRRLLRVPFLVYVVHFVYGTCLCLAYSVDILIYYFGMDVSAPLMCGGNGIRSCFISLLSHYMLFTSLEAIHL